MPVTAKTRRRWFGALCLLAALVLLVAGDTRPRPDANHVFFVTYWLACFLLAALAMATAILDARALRREARDEQRALFEHTLHEIEEKRAGKRNGPHQPKG